MENNSSLYWIKALLLELDPCGGYFKPICRAEAGEDTAIKRAYPMINLVYHLIMDKQICGFYELLNAETWYFHRGEPVLIHSLSDYGKLVTAELSGTGEGNLCITFKARTWVAIELKKKMGFALISCAVLPNHNYSPPERNGVKYYLRRRFPYLKQEIDRLCLS